MSQRLDAAGNAAYRALAALLLPGTAAMPAVDCGQAAARLDEVLGWRPDLAPDVLRGVNAVKNQSSTQAWALLETGDPLAYAAIRLIILGSYLMQPDAMRALAYPGALSQPVQAGETPDYLRSGLLYPVQARGEIWRSVQAITALAE